jgi:hypothetical protein
MSDYAVSTALAVPDPLLFGEVLMDGRYGRTINGFKMLHGRRLDPGGNDEAVPTMKSARPPRLSSVHRVLTPSTKTRRSATGPSNAHA